MMTLVQRMTYMSIRIVVRNITITHPILSSVAQKDLAIIQEVFDSRKSRIEC